MQNNSRELTYKMRTEIFASKKTLLLDWFVYIWQDRESQKERKEKFTVAENILFSATDGRYKFAKQLHGLIAV